MKIFRILFSAILLVLFTGCVQDNIEQDEPIAAWLKTLPGVQKVEELPTQHYKKHYLVVFKQMLDPKNPAAGTFLQRVFLSHQDFGQPVVLETDGYEAESSMDGPIQSELTMRYKANMVVVEHRYSGRSLGPANNWSYLTCENAAADLHAVRVALGTKYTGNWIATGVSKGGSNSMSYTMFYPGDVTATVAYVGPICTGKADTRFIDHILNVGTPQMRKKVVDFQREMLIRRNEIQPVFFTTPAEPTEAKEFMTNDQMYENSTVELMHNILQSGWEIDDIPAASATTQQMIDYLRKQKVFGGEDVSPMPRKGDREYISISKYLRAMQNQLTKANDEPDLSATHYFVQTLIELGSYAYAVKPVEDLIPNHKSWSLNTIARFVVPVSASNIQFSDNLLRKTNQWLQSNDPQLICVYGEYDPWTAAAANKTYFEGKANMAIFIQEKGSHSAEIEKLSPTDKQQAWDRLDKWVKH